MAIAANSLKMGEPLELMIDGTLFKADYNSAARSYQVTSRTPIAERQPLILHTLILRTDAEQYKKKNFIGFWSDDTAALQLGIERLTPDIAEALRELPVTVRSQDELESLEGFGSF